MSVKKVRVSSKEFEKLQKAVNTELRPHGFFIRSLVKTPDGKFSFELNGELTKEQRIILQRVSRKHLK